MKHTERQKILPEGLDVYDNDIFEATKAMQV